MDILALLPQFGGFVWTVLAFLIALSVIVAVHEYGHYIVGRWSGIHAEVFSIGFGPVLYSRHDRRGTRWQVAALPLGGYVKFKGDSNAASGQDEAAMAKAALDPAELRSTMHGAPLWARTLTVLAGPVFNFVLSILVFAGVLLVIGVERGPMIVADIHPTVQAQELEKGDQILEIAGIEAPMLDDGAGFGNLLEGLPREPVLDYLVLRDGSRQMVRGPYLLPPLIEQLAPRSAAIDSGLEAGDLITRVNGDPVYALDQLRDVVESSDGAAIALEVLRGAETLEFTLVPRLRDEPQADGSFAANWRIGIAGGTAFEMERTSPGVGTALWAGVAQTGRIISGSISGLGAMISGAISSCNMSGAITIAQVSGQMASQGIDNFIWFIAVLSAAVGLLNLFPIPALDGGHLLFYAYEAVTGRPPNERFAGILMAIGIALVLTLMVFALLNDILCP